MMEGDAPEEEEPEQFLPPLEEPVVPWGEVSSSWSEEPSSWEASRMSFSAHDVQQDPWSYQYYPGAGGSSWGPQ